MAEDTNTLGVVVYASCCVCGLPFEYLKKAKSGRPRTLCGDTCKAKRKERRLASAVCKTCGKNYRPRYGRSAGFCSYDCRRYPEARKYASKQEAGMARWYRRRARKHAVKYERFSRPSIYRRDNWICGICGEPVDPSLKHPHFMSASLDHIVPLSKGGSHTRDNAQLAHMICNARKQAN